MRSTPISWERIPQGHPHPPGQVETAANQFRASLQRHLDALIEEEEGYPSANTMHQYAASLLREIKAWVEAS